jgi:hypothetical protein
MDDRYELQARNEALLRTVNERIKEIDKDAGAWSDPKQRFWFQCECGNTETCSERIEMTLAEYERVRSQRDRFAVLPGHQTDNIERVVETSDRYLIVDKVDAVEPLVD